MGKWSGVGPGGTNILVVIDSQNGGGFAGTADVGGASAPIIGSCTPDGGIKFSQQGGGANFGGSVSIGIKMSGTVTLSDGTSGKFTIIKS